MRRAVLFCIGKALGAMLSHHFLTLLHCANPKHNLVWSPPGGNNTVIPNITSQNRLTIYLGAPCCFLQVTHHDIKSSNILLNQDATVAKIADVGTSRLAEMTHSTSSLEAVGTFAYAAPEQLMGQRHQCTNKVAFDHVMTKGMNLAHCSWNGFADLHVPAKPSIPASICCSSTSDLLGISELLGFWHPLCDSHTVLNDLAALHLCPPDCPLHVLGGYVQLWSCPLGDRHSGKATPRRVAHY